MPLRRNRPHRAAWVATTALAALAPLVGAASAETLSGQVRVLERGQPAADPSGTIVYYVPEGGARRPPPANAEIMTRDRRFAPRVIAVPVGSTVRFPNGDPVRHNVFSVSAANRFDLGLYARGPGKAKRFDAPGVVRLFCNVHRSMAAYVLVLETPYYAAADAQGRFTLEGLPAGSGTLRAWNPRATEASRALSLPAAAALEIVLDATLPPVPQHLNKYGRPYRDDAGDESYR